MKTTELRLGNYITDGTFQYSVVGINFDESIWGSIDKVVNHVKAETEDYYKQGDYHLNIENVQPIPLTEEWLLKFGFEKVIHAYVMGIHNRIFSGLMKFQFDRLLQMWVFSVGKYKDITRIEYVHQLQNLYFALTGDELEIKE